MSYVIYAEAQNPAKHATLYVQHYSVETGEISYTTDPDDAQVFGKMGVASAVARFSTESSNHKAWCVGER